MISGLNRNRRSLTTSLATSIRNSIISGAFKPGDVLPPARKLATEHNIGQNTANRALDLLVEEGLIYRVKGKGSFVSSQSSKNINEQRNVGVVFHPTQGDEYTVKLAFGSFHENCISELQARNTNITSIMMHELEDPKVASEKLSLLDGVILLSSAISDPLIENLIVRNGCTVLTQISAEAFYPFHQVIPDSIAGFAKGLELLTSINDGPIAIITKPTLAFREEALYKAARFLDIPMERLVRIEVEPVIGDLGRIAGQKAGQQILQRNDIKAAFSLSDFLSFGIVDVIQSKGKEIGRDLMLVSYDNFEGEGLLPFEQPLITSISIPRNEIAKQTAKLLYDVMDDKSKCQHIVKAPTELIQRQSTLGM